MIKLILSTIDHIITNWRTSLAGVLIAVATVLDVLQQSGVTGKSIGTTTYVGLGIALSAALLGLLARDPKPSSSPVVKLLAYAAVVAGYGMIGLLVTMSVSGCAGLPQWISSFEQLVPAMAASIASVVTAVGALTGDPALSAAGTAISLIATKVENGLKDLQQLVDQYQSAQDADTKHDLLSKIEDAAKVVISDLNQLGGDFGVPAAVTAPIAALASLVLSQLQAWLSIIPTLKASTGQQASTAIAIPMSAKQFKEAHNAVVANAKTGSEGVDAIFGENLKILS
jgi:hypothetical protein